MEGVKKGRWGCVSKSCKGKCEFWRGGRSERQLVANLCELDARLTLLIDSACLKSMISWWITCNKFSLIIAMLKPLMRSHYLWPQKSQNHTIPVNLEAIQTTTIASKLFQPLYLGYNRVLHYIIYGMQLSNFDISLAFTSDWHPQTYPLSSNISSRS